MKFNKMEDNSPKYNNLNNFNSQSIMQDITFKNISNINSDKQCKKSTQKKPVSKKIDYNAELLDDLIFEQALNGSWTSRSKMNILNNLAFENKYESYKKFLLQNGIDNEDTILT